MLVERGVTFVGHGLRKDFRVVNLTVPPAQVIDTVELWHAEHQRKVSLRFLAGFLLRRQIQEDTHDSIEDARTALHVYRMHARLAQVVSSSLILFWPSSASGCPWCGGGG